MKYEVFSFQDIGRVHLYLPVFYKKMIQIHLRIRKIEALFEVGNGEVSWNICETGYNSIYADITNYKEGCFRNYIITVDGGIKDNNAECLIQNCYFQENILESSDNSLEVFIDYLLKLSTPARRFMPCHVYHRLRVMETTFRFLIKNF